ncbi:fumarate hydratase [Bacillus coahuilensis p1.1.43]|uniref:Fumarate hydratase class II n=1 Tax=Bacillus coahuilensis p1.1.43 TaxID=1150625 RepID=A0A147KAX4_9BACI|nr:class II fumarate hydratase [Bacillus coahuilensis]KUP07914.1 fumarate hydratase [Bacillus coahuilensis p1.1.43]
MDYRIERDSMGEIKVDSTKKWGAQTERSRQNFHIGEENMPIEVIYGFALLKKGAAAANERLGTLSKEKSLAIQTVCDQILSGELDDEFPLKVWQTGSGTQSNMNVNEVIANVANEAKYSDTIHPNDDVNKSQSSNDTFPTAMHIAAYKAVQEQLLPAIKEMNVTLLEKEKKYWETIKIGRTHLQDATPLTLGQEISGWRTMLLTTEEMIHSSSTNLLSLAIGGTAVGTGINAHRAFGPMVAEQISHYTGYPFRSSENKFHSLTSHDELVFVHGGLKALAANVMKIANDVRWLSSGPRSGLGEITIPANEPGSSIMPGKVNPTQSEAITMVATQVFGNDATIGFAASQGNFELNVFKPVIIYNFLQSVRLLAESIDSFTKNCLKGLEINEENMKRHVDHSLMLVTALNPYIGYEKAAKIAKAAYDNNTSLKEAAITSGYVTAEQYDTWMDPYKMVNLD